MPSGEESWSGTTVVTGAGAVSSVLAKPCATEMATFKPWIEKSCLLTVIIAEQMLKHLKDRDLEPR